MHVILHAAPTEGSVLVDIVTPGTTPATRAIEVIARRLRIVTDQNRCFLGEEEQRVISSLLRTFPEDFVAGLEDAAPPEPVPVPKLVDLRDGIATLDPMAGRKRPDWTYEPV